jgi:hypothetical protein
MKEFNFSRFSEELEAQGIETGQETKILSFSVDSFCGRMPRDAKKCLEFVELIRIHAEGTKFAGIHSRLLNRITRRQYFRRHVTTLFEPRFGPGVKNSIGDWLIHPWKPGSYVSLRQWLADEGYPYARDD